MDDVRFDGAKIVEMPRSIGELLQAKLETDMLYGVGRSQLNSNTTLRINSVYYFCTRNTVI
jgi:hypothetical protein